jgi:phage shock protein PspC (stress-responsive transcriptional regulator)
MKDWIEDLKHKLEQQGYEVCSRLGYRLGIDADRIRLFFIYTSFATLGSPVIFYLTLAFFLKIKDRFIARRKTVFDL